MSCPSFIKAFKHDIEVSHSYNNWGWVSPSDYQIAVRIIEIVSDNYPDNKNEFAKDWDYLIDRHFGKLTRQNYEIMYDEAKKVYDGKIKTEDFDVFKYITPL